MTDYNQGFADYLNNATAPAEPSDEYLRGWYDGMDFDAGFRN